MNEEGAGAVTMRIDAMVGGVEKGGTTSLGVYLASHRRVLSHLGEGMEADDIEFSAFVDGSSRDPEDFRRAYLEAFGREPADSEVVVGKSVGILHLPDAARELYRLYPECRVILSLRHPVERAYSAYLYQHYRGVEEAETFEEALEQERQREEEGVWAPHRMYLGKGRYVEHLESLLELFDPEQVHVLMLEDLEERPEETVNEVFAFLGLTPHSIEGSVVVNRAKTPRWPWLARAVQRESLLKEAFRAFTPRTLRLRLWRWLRRMNAQERKPPPMSEGTRVRLQEYFRPYNRRLEELLGRDLSAWDDRPSEKTGSGSR